MTKKQLVLFMVVVFLTDSLTAIDVTTDPTSLPATAVVKTTGTLRQAVLTNQNSNAHTHVPLTKKSTDTAPKNQQNSNGTAPALPVMATTEKVVTNQVNANNSAKTANHTSVNKTSQANATSGTGSKNQQPNTGDGLANLQAITKLLGTFLPKQSLDLFSMMAGNESARTLPNVVKAALPVAKMAEVRALTQNGVSQKCGRDLGLIIDGIIAQAGWVSNYGIMAAQEAWALKMLDATFKIPANLLDNVMGGTPKALGDYDECLSIEAVVDKATGNVIRGKYCLASINYPVPPAAKALNPAAGYAFFGLCVSKSCSASDVAVIISNLERQLLNGTVEFQPNVECAEKKQWATDMIAVTCLLAILGAMVVIGTLYDAFGVHLRKDTQQEQNDKPKREHINGYEPTVAFAENGTPKAEMTGMKNGVSNGGYIPNDAEKMGDNMAVSETNVDTGINNGNVSVHVPVERTQQEPRQKKIGTLEQICLSFSVYSNGVKLLGTNQGSGSLGAVNGIRFLSMAWVILGHTYYFAGGYDSNLLPMISKQINDWTFTAIPYAGVSVDSFFALSGVLVAYLTLRELKKMGGASNLNWFMFYFHRFWRLTPPYMLVLMVGTVVLPYVIQGPMTNNDDLPFMGGCRTHWWANLLYVNNYVTEDSCMGWSWYLANDMQFFIISPLILLPFFYNAIAGAIVSGAFLIATITAVGTVAKNHEYAVQMFSQFQHTPKDGNYMKNLYVPSYARMGPYLVGLITGYLLYNCKCKCRIPRMANVAGWLLCLGTTCAVIYGEYTDGDSHVMSLWENVIFMALFRTVWGVAVCWVIFACATGYGGWINDILAWKAFVPLGRLTYCAYLVHPLVMLVYYRSRRSPVFFNDYEAIYLFLAHMVMSYGVAFVTSLFFESPMMGLEKAVFKKDKRIVFVMVRFPDCWSPDY